MLYLVAVPIGNLEDITYRAVKILASCDYILCEDSRKSQILLSHYAIKKELISFHKFCEKKRENKVLCDLQSGKHIALISDAGTPLLSDPGLLLIQKCIALKIPFTSLPGPSALLNALLLSGCSSTPLLFLGFLDKKRAEKEKNIKKMLFFSGTSLAFETSQRIEETLQMIETYDKNRSLVVAREMTKKFEEILRGNASEILAHFQKKSAKGELVLVVSPGDPISSLALEELILWLQELHGLDEKQALIAAAKIRKCPKKIFYKALKKKE